MRIVVGVGLFVSGLFILSESLCRRAFGTGQKGDPQMGLASLLKSPSRSLLRRSGGLYAEGNWV